MSTPLKVIKYTIKQCQIFDQKSTVKQHVTIFAPKTIIFQYKVICAKFLIFCMKALIPFMFHDKYRNSTDRL